MVDREGSEGWYPDPTDPSRLRWWNAVTWTEHTRPATAHVPPPTQTPPPVVLMPPTSRARVTRHPSDRPQARPAVQTKPSTGTLQPLAARSTGATNVGRNRIATGSVVTIFALVVLSLAIAGGPDPTSKPSAMPGLVEGLAHSDTASVQLSELVVAEPDPGRPAYVRSQYQPRGWSDFDGDCLSTRHEVLAASSQVTPTFDETGCKVEAGLWLDPFTGETLTTSDEATIDHLIPLAEAHRAGGWKWDLGTKERFANDETSGQLRVVGAEVNQSKGDKGPNLWLPPAESSHCSYATNWIAVKHRWLLTVTPPEVEILRGIIANCRSGENINDFASAPPLIVTTTIATPTTTTIQTSFGPGIVELLSCDSRAERVVIANTGGEPVPLAGFRLHDEGDKHAVGLGQFGSLEPGASLAILTGPDALTTQGAVVWKQQDVWNNDGDTAYLVAPNGAFTESRC